MKQRRFLSVLLALCLVLGMCHGTVFAAGGRLPFTDVKTADWYYDAVQYVYEKGMMTGTGATTFSPNNTTSRGMIVTILHRLDGTPSATGAAFTDVPAGQWYTDAVAWASANEIVGGYGDGKFGPDDPITREQMATILYRYSRYKGYDTTVSGSLSGFPDAAKTSSYAADAMGWAVGTGLIAGMDDGTLAPQGSATRAQAATIFMRYCENIIPEREPEPDNKPASETYTVTFAYNYGSQGTYKTLTVTAGETVATPDDPVRSGYVFDGWYTKASSGEKFDFDTEITKDITLYAQWKQTSSGGSDYVFAPDHETYYTVTFDANGSNVENLPKPQEIKAGNYAIEPEPPTRENYVFYGWHPSPNAVAFMDNPLDFNNFTIEEDLILYAIWASVTVDVDADGLSYDEELHYNTDPYQYDTDADGLSDGEEVNTYHTNPLNRDTDGDGIIDGAEVSLTLNPLNNKTDGTTDDSERIIEKAFQDDNNVFELTVRACPATLCSFTIETFDSAYAISGDTYGLISPIIEIDYNTSYDFENAELVFDYSSINLDGIDENNLTFLYLNEETGTYELVPSTVDYENQLVIAKPTHFSSYVVGDKNKDASSFVYANTSLQIEYGNDTIKVKEVVATNFDVRQHAFAFHNFQYKNYPGGFCYGFSFVTYLNYIQKLPVKGDGYFSIPMVSNVQGYDLTEVNRFYQNQLYIESEKDLFKEEENYFANNVSVDGPTKNTMKSIVYWFGKQHTIQDKFRDNLSSAYTLLELKNKLANDDPVPLVMYGNGTHCVLACGLYRSEENSDIYYISIYDSNCPGEMQYIKLSRHGFIIETNSLEYNSYNTFRLAHFTIPDEGPFVTHELDPIIATAISGIVKDADTDKPIEGVTVYLNCIFGAGGEDLAARCETAADGTFTMDIPQSESITGVSSIEFQKDGYNSYRLSLDSSTNFSLGTIKLVPIDSSIDSSLYTFEIEENIDKRTFTTTSSGSQAVALTYQISTDIPDFDASNVQWTTTSTVTDLQTDGQNAVVTTNTGFTITASYTYNGYTYTCDHQVSSLVIRALLGSVQW